MERMSELTRLDFSDDEKVPTASAQLAVPPQKLINSLFVSKYQLELPKKDDIQRFLEEQMQAGLVPGSRVKERRQ